MIGLEAIGLQTTVLGIPQTGELGQLLIKITLLMGILVLTSHIITRLLKKII